VERLERGIIQRVKALEMYLDDIYGDQEISTTVSSRAG